MENNFSERQVSLLDLFKYVLGKWKVIVAVALVLALALGLYGIISSKNASPEDSSEVKALTSKMTKDEIESVEDSAKIIKSYRQIYTSQKFYNENSIYQRLDAFSIDTLELTYFVDNHYKVSYPIIDEQNNLVPMIMTYAASLSKDSLYDELANAVDSSINPAYYQELITVDTEEKSDGIFTITIYADENELLSKIGEYIKNAMEEESIYVTDLYGEHDLILTSETKSKKVDTDVAEGQQKNVQILTTITRDIVSIESNYSDEALTYLKYLVHDKPETSSGVAKYFVIGAFFGVAFVALYYMAKYLFDGTVKTESELTSVLKANSFGSLDDDAEFIASRINNAVENNSTKRLVIVANKENDKIIALKDLIKANVVLAIDILNNQDAFESFVSCDSAVFVEDLKFDKYKSVVKEKSMCDDSNITVLGFIS